jgi:hypothetical protein
MRNIISLYNTSCLISRNCIWVGFENISSKINLLSNKCFKFARHCTVNLKSIIMEMRINWVAVLVATLASMFIGFLWYGVLFQEQWMAGHGITMEGEKAFKNGVEMPMSAAPMIINFVAMAVYALVINWLLGLTGMNTWMDGAKVGGAIGLLMAIGVYVGNMFAQNPMSVTMVDASYVLVLFTVIGAILGGWRKRGALAQPVKTTGSLVESE